MDNHVQHNLTDGNKRIIPTLHILHLIGDDNNGHIDVLFHKSHYLLHFADKIALQPQGILNQDPFIILEMAEFDGGHDVFSLLEQQVCPVCNIPIFIAQLLFSQKHLGRIVNAHATTIHPVNHLLHQLHVKVSDGMLGVGIEIPTRVAGLQVQIGDLVQRQQMVAIGLSAVVAPFRRHWFHWIFLHRKLDYGFSVHFNDVGIGDNARPRLLLDFVDPLGQRFRPQIYAHNISAIVHPHIHLAPFGIGKSHQCHNHLFIERGLELGVQVFF